MKPYFCVLSELQKWLNKVHEEPATDINTAKHFWVQGAMNHKGTRRKKGMSKKEAVP